MPTSSDKRKVVDQISNAILEGKLDPHLETIALVIRDRHRAIRFKKAAKVVNEARVGRRVRLTTIKPKYLERATGTIIDPPSHSRAYHKPMIWVVLDKGRVGRYGPEVAVPAASLEYID